jgi:hypothetical protein
LTAGESGVGTVQRTALVLVFVQQDFNRARDRVWWRSSYVALQLQELEYLVLVVLGYRRQPSSHI